MIKSLLAEVCTTFVSFGMLLLHLFCIFIGSSVRFSHVIFHYVLFLKIEKSTKNNWFLACILVFFLPTRVLLLLLLFEIFETRTIWQYEIFSFCFLTLPRGKLSCMS